jgi:hypothetical protein
LLPTSRPRSGGLLHSMLCAFAARAIDFGASRDSYAAITERP